MLLTEVGPVDVAVPRDREGTFAPAIVPKRSRRLGGVEDLVVSLSAKGLTHGEICAHLAEVYGAEVSKDRITAITDRVMDGLNEWQSRPLPGVSGDLHRLHPREDPRWSGRQPSHLRGAGGHGGWRARHPRVVGR